LTLDVQYESHTLNLKPYERDDGLSFKCWSDRQIEPGQVWREEIKAALMQCSLAVLLVTQEFLASDFIAHKELQPLLALAEKDGGRILWVAISDSTVADTVISSYQSLNNPDRPLDRIPKPQRNGELARIAKRIHAMACEWREGENLSSGSTAPVGADRNEKCDPAVAPQEGRPQVRVSRRAGGLIWPGRRRSHSHGNRTTACGETGDPVLSVDAKKKELVGPPCSPNSPKAKASATIPKKMASDFQPPKSPATSTATAALTKQETWPGNQKPH